MPFDSTEQKLDTNQSHTSENNTVDAVHQNKHGLSREAELQDAFRKADFSERAGSPAQRLEIMSKAANDLVLERQEVAAAKQKEEDSGFWEAERGKVDSSTPAEKDTAIKPAPIAVEQQKKEEAKPEQADIKPKEADSKIDSKIDSKPSSPKPSKAKQQQKPTHDDDDDHSSEMPSERRSKLDRISSANDPAPNVTTIEKHIPSELLEQARAEHKERRAMEDADNARQLDWSPNGEEKHLNKTLAKRKAWQAKHGREIDDPDNHTQTGARPTLREELAHHTARLSSIWGASSTDSKDSEQRVPTATHVPTTLELHNKQLDRRALRGDDDATIEQQQRPGLTASIGAKLHDAKEMVVDKIEAAEDKLAHWKDEAVEKMEQVKEKAIDLKDDAAHKAAELRDDASKKATEIKRDAISKKDEISRDMDIKRKEISRDIDSKRADISRDIDSKRAEISRDIDSKRADIGRKADSIERDVRTRSAELKADAKDATSTIRAKAHTISEDVKSEVREDIAAVKAKMSELGRSLSHKKDEVREDIKDTAHHQQIDWANRRSGAIAHDKPAAGGLMDKMSSWWSSGRQQEQQEVTLSTGATGTMFPSHRLSRDPDAKDMQAKLDELRAAEGGRKPMRGHDASFAGGVREQLSHGWQSIKTEVREDITAAKGKAAAITAPVEDEPDYVDLADKASAFDIDNAPSSPRSWSSSSPRSPASPIQRSASPVSYRRSASPVAAGEGSFFAGFDPTIMDACVEPW